MADLVNVVQLRSVLSIDPSKDANFIRLLSQIYGLLETKTNRLWLQRTGYVETFTPENRMGQLRLALYPVASVTEVIEWMGLDGVGEATVVPTTDYAVNPDTGRLTRFVAPASNFLRDGSLYGDVLW